MHEQRMNLGEMRSRVLVTLGDPEGERYATDWIDENLNEALLDFFIETEIVYENLTVLLEEGKTEYDIRELVVADGSKRQFLYVVRVTYNDGPFDGRQSVRPTSQYILDRRGVGYGETGSTRGFTIDMMEPHKIKAYPEPLNDGDALPLKTGNLVVTYAAIPNEMDSDDDFPDSVRAEFIEALTQRAAALILEGGEFDDIETVDDLNQDFLEATEEATSDLGMEPYGGNTA